ncbi:MAG: hypothetical protein HY050_03035 [Actinobacteria bacterium]|nr:hypothetical protein [Actinomycetota bacterium]
MRKDPMGEHLELNSREVGILILNGTPNSRELAITWAKTLNGLGVSVEVPLLNEISHDWKELNFDQWKKWLDIANDALSQLMKKCSIVFIAGLDAASTIALRLAQIHGDEIDGLILVEPTLPNNHFQVRKIWKTVDQGLLLVDQPIVLLYSTKERINYSESAITISKNISSAFIREVILENSSNDLATILDESSVFINEVTNGIWLTNISSDDDSELVDAEFASIVAGLSLDQSSPSNYLDSLDNLDPEDHFEIPDPALEPIHDPAIRNSIIAMILGPIYALIAAFTGFDPFGIEPWPGILAFLGGLIYFFYQQQESHGDDDGAIL